MATVALISAAVVANGTPKSSDATSFGHAHNGAVLCVDIAMGANTKLVTLTFFGRTVGDAGWRTLNVVNLNTQSGDLVTSIAYTATYASQNAVVIPVPVDEILVTATNTGDNNATVTVSAFVR